MRRCRPRAEGSGHHKAPEIGLYPGFDPRRPPGESSGRYFALTGLHLPARRASCAT